MRLGLDIHGVIDTNPDYFSKLIRKLRNIGHSVHIITGTPNYEIAYKFDQWGISYDDYFSIAEWCEKYSPTHFFNDKGQVCDIDDVWNNAKAQYCVYAGIDIHVDDSTIYQKTFENISTRFVLFDGVNKLNLILEEIIK